MKYAFWISAVLTLGVGCKSHNNIAKLTSKRDTTAIADIKPKELPKLKSVTVFYVQPTEVLASNQIVPPRACSAELASHIQDDLQLLYTERKSEPLWIDSKGLKPTLLELKAQVETASLHGLDPESYGLSEINRLIAKIGDEHNSPEDLALYDMTLSFYYLLYNYHLVNGRFNPDRLNGIWFLDKKNIDLPTELAKVNGRGSLSRYFKKLTPEDDRYIKLINYLTFYKTIAKKGGWPYIDETDFETIEPGDKHPRVADIRKRLTVTDPMKTKKDANPEEYDIFLEEAVKKFQMRHGLEADGRIGKGTLAAMNIPVEEKIRLIELNLERHRWLPHRFADDYLMVNIPDYKLTAYKNAKPRLTMKVIVGKGYTSTPIFSDTLKYLVFSPTWTVPKSIKVKEMLPRLQRNPYSYGRSYKFYRGVSNDPANEVNPGYVDWTKYSANYFPFNIVQQPGPYNALGLVKFIMPNNFNIYLHDTPTDYLFDRTDRAFSHGCIRLEQPAELAKYLLQDQKDWDDERINEHMLKDSPVYVHFTNDYQVQIAYLTAFVDDAGIMNFRKDVYGHDKAQFDAIDKMASR